MKQKRLFAVLLLCVACGVFLSACNDNEDGSKETPTVTPTEKAQNPDNNRDGTVTTDKLIIEVNGHTLTATLADNSSVDALKALLAKGPVTIDMHDFSNFEKVGELPEELPRNDEQLNTDYGDLILYLGKRFVIYYDKNSWNFTKLGHIDNITQKELKEILGEGDVTATISLKGSE